MGKKGFVFSYLMIALLTVVVIVVAIGLLLFFGKINFAIPSMIQDFFERFTVIVWG